ncbi:MAG: hypothetical protein IPJ37_10125 [Bacteroidales bacterium]|nr:hypothetical protein [Bacteroidales bacterium]
MNILSGYDLLSSFIMSNLINKNGRFLIHKTAISGVLLFYLCFSGFSQTTKTSTVEASVALAYPVTNITIDGNDTDWPVKSVKYRIGNIFWKKPDTNADISGYFMTGYNPVEQALYFAVVVSDDSTSLILLQMPAVVIRIPILCTLTVKICLQDQELFHISSMRYGNVFQTLQTAGIPM